VAFVAAYVALRMTKYVQQNITMILTALLIAFQDPIIALATGFAAYFVLEWHWKKESKFEDPEVTLFVEKTLKE
jgi:phosphate/sulfate permease